MPLYEFRCSCGHRFEAIKPIEDRDTAICPECGWPASKKLSTFSFTFGWVLSEESHIKGPDKFVRAV